jgi:hypothetical protein
VQPTYYCATSPSAVERPYGDFKGLLAVTPVFVQKNSRVAALVHVT